MDDKKDEFLAQKEAIRFCDEYSNGDKFSFAMGFEHAMKLIKDKILV